MSCGRHEYADSRLEQRMPRNYREDLVVIEEFTRSLGRPPKILNVGSGPGKVEGYLNVDRLPLEGVDVVADLDHVPWPFKDDRFEIILCNHCIEHVQDIVCTMEEIHRVGKQGCRVVIRTPYFANVESFRDPTHRWHLTWQSFGLFRRWLRFLPLHGPNISDYQQGTHVPAPLASPGLLPVPSQCANVREILLTPLPRDVAARGTRSGQEN